MPWPGIFTGILWLGFYYWCANHVVVQKVLAAKNIDHGRWGALFAGFMQLPLLVLLIFPGIIGRDFFADSTTRTGCGRRWSSSSCPSVCAGSCSPR